MTIINKTTIEPDMIKGAMRASNFDNSKYKMFKLIYNLFGLLFGMMLVRYLVLELIGSVKADRVMLWFYIFATIILLYLGMIGMDRNNKKRFDKVYRKMIGITFTYELDSEEIVMTDPDSDSETFGWDKVLKWNQDMDNFYLFVGAEECLILSKKGFTQGQEKDMKELVTAIMGLRQSESATNQDEKEVSESAITTTESAEVVEKMTEAAKKTSDMTDEDKNEAENRDNI